MLSLQVPYLIPAFALQIFRRFATWWRVCRQSRCPISYPSGCERGVRLGLKSSHRGTRRFFG